MQKDTSNLNQVKAPETGQVCLLKSAKFIYAAACFLTLTLASGCEPSTKQKISDKLGEREVTALQDIARDRECLPLPDIQLIRKAQQSPDQIEFLLRDGSRWVNSTSPLKCQIPQPLTIAVDPANKTLCAGDSVRLLQTGAPALMDMGQCQLTRFQRR